MEDAGRPMGGLSPGSAAVQPEDLARLGRFDPEPLGLRDRRIADPDDHVRRMGFAEGPVPKQQIAGVEDRRATRLTSRAEVRGGIREYRPASRGPERGDRVREGRVVVARPDQEDAPLGAWASPASQSTSSRAGIVRAAEKRGTRSPSPDAARNPSSAPSAGGSGSLRGQFRWTAPDGVDVASSTARPASCPACRRDASPASGIGTSLAQRV